MDICIEDFTYDCTYKGEMETWLYKGDTEYRYVLGKCGKNPLICFGINPSNACIEGIGKKGGVPRVHPDNTMIRVRNISELLEFDGYIMLNLYPIIDKDPSILKKAEKEFVERMIDINLEYITAVFEDFRDSKTLWACWGTSITNGDYLIESLEHIDKIVKKYNKEWKTIKWTKARPVHPHHPLRISNKEVKNNFQDVLIDKYIKTLRGEE